MKREWMVMVLALVALPGLLFGDIMMKQKVHQDGSEIMGQSQPETNEIQTVWFSKDRLMSQGRDNSILIRLDQKKMYTIDHVSQTYTELPMDLGKMAQKMGGDDKDAADLQKMMGNMMKMEISVEPTGEKKKINSWQCRKYIQTIKMMMGEVTNEVWATEDIDVNMELYRKMKVSHFAQNPMLKSMAADFEKEFKKIKGVVIRSEGVTEMMGQEIKNSTELLEIKEKKAPAGTYDLPKGYKKSSM